MRAFVALDLDAELRDRALALARGAAGSARVRWTRPDLVHLTVRFLGDVDEEVALGFRGAIERAVAELGTPARLELVLERFVAFPDPRRAHVVAFEVAASPLLARLAATIAAHAGVVCQPDRIEGSFVPHVTVARAKAPADVRGWTATSFAPLVGRATGLTLYESVLGATGPTYTARIRVALG